MKHTSFPSIEQFRHCVQSVARHVRYAGRDANDEPIYNTAPLPTLKFEGTVKLHGTNAAIGFDRNLKEFWFQSRENIISLESDNCGFVRFFNDKLDSLRLLFDQLPLGNEVLIFGEWCGKGVQKGVAISELPKMLVVFDVLIDGVWQPKSVVKQIANPERGVHNIYDFLTVSISIDFEKPEVSQNQLGELTMKVEAECPVGKALGVSGVGEGIVWRCVTPGFEDPRFRFKVKGEKHSVSKVKTLAAVDVEMVANIREFADKVTTENRLRQGIDVLRQRNITPDKRALGEFIKWVVGDVEKEEKDTAAASGIDFNKAKGEISNRARTWFFKNELSF